MIQDRTLTYDLNNSYSNLWENLQQKILHLHDQNLLLLSKSNRVVPVCDLESPLEIPTRFIPGWASAFHFAFFSKLNIVNEKMYEVLSMVYQEFLELFDTDVFHMGGDEVNMNCYNTSKEIRDYLENDNKIGTEEDILDLWRTFQTKVSEILERNLIF